MLLVLAGHLLAESRRTLGKAGLGRVVVEVAVMNVVLLIAMELCFLLSRPLDNLVSFPPLLLSIFGVPCWAAVRLLDDQSITSEVAVRRLIKMTAFLAGTNIATFIFGVVVFPVLLRSGLTHPIYNLIRFQTQASIALTLGIVVTFEFVFYRGLMDLIFFIRNRSFVPRPTLPVSNRFVWRFRMLIGLTIVTLAVWLISCRLYSHRQTHPASIYVPALFSEPLPEMPPFNAFGKLRIATKPPADRPLVSFLAAAVPPIFILLLGWFVARWRISDTAAQLFCASCLLHGIWGLDVLPRVGGNIIWAAHALAWLLAGPVQLHLALAFAAPLQSLPPLFHALWVRLRVMLYGGTFIIAPLWVYLNLSSAAHTMVLCQNSPYVIPLILLACCAGLLWFPLSCTLAVYALWKTWTGLQACRTATPETSASGCNWVDLVEFKRSDWVDIEVAKGLRQIKVIAWGAMLSFVSFVGWLVLAVPVFGRYGVSADWFVRWAIAIFFLSVALAILQLRLWNISRIMVVASLWPPIAILLPTVYKAAKALVQNATAPTLGIAATVLIAYIPLTPVTRLVYRRIFRSKNRWQRKLRDLATSISDGRLKSIGGLLNEACQEGTYAAWFLRPAACAKPSGFRALTVHHSTGCYGQCLPLLANKLNGTISAGTGFLLGNELWNWLLRPAKNNLDRVLCVPRLIAAQESWWRGVVSKAMQRVPGISKQPMLIKATWLHAPPVDPSFLYRLNAARIALILRFGGANNLHGVFIIATDGEGDYYDQEDLKALGELARSISDYQTGQTAVSL